MATSNIFETNLNNQKRSVKAAVMTLPAILPGGTSLVSGDTYLAGKIPAGAIVTSIYGVPVTAFNQAMTLNVGTDTDSTSISNVVSAFDAAGTTTSTGVSGAKNKMYAVDTNLYIKPTFATVPTAGEAQFIVEFIDSKAKTGEYL